MTLELPPRRDGHAADEGLKQKRAAGAAAPSRFLPLEEVAVEHRQIGGAPCVVVTPPNARGVAVYFHGGGYRQGSPEASAPFAAHLAAEGAVQVICPRYGLAPEQPFPNGLHDGMGVLDALGREGAPFTVVGASAGGGLALSLALLARGTAARISGLVLISPWADLTLTAESYGTRAETDQLFSLAAATEASRLYLQGAAADHPLASPLLADLAGLPPTMVLVGGAEVLLDDSLELARRLATAGVTVEFLLEPDAQHVWPTIFPELAESQRAMEAMGRFIRATRVAAAEAG